LQAANDITFFHRRKRDGFAPGSHTKRATNRVKTLIVLTAPGFAAAPFVTSQLLGPNFNLVRAFYCPDESQTSARQF
jgi:hypothetical protein